MRHEQPRRESMPPQCFNCGYDLAGKSIGDACPECGVVIDPVRIDGPLGSPKTRRTLRIAAWCAMLAATLTCVAAIAGHGVPILQSYMPLDDNRDQELALWFVRAYMEATDATHASIFAALLLSMLLARQSLPRRGVWRRALLIAALVLFVAGACQFSVNRFIKSSQSLPGFLLGVKDYLDYAIWLVLAVFAAALHQIARGADLTSYSARASWTLCALFVERAIGGQVIGAFVVNGYLSQTIWTVYFYAHYASGPIGIAFLAIALMRLQREARRVSVARNNA
jgi:hypothetical protein